MAPKQGKQSGRHGRRRHQPSLPAEAGGAERAQYPAAHQLDTQTPRSHDILLATRAMVPLSSRDAAGATLEENTTWQNRQRNAGRQQGPPQCKMEGTGTQPAAPQRSRRWQVRCVPVRPSVPPARRAGGGGAYRFNRAGRPPGSTGAASGGGACRFDRAYHSLRDAGRCSGQRCGGSEQLERMCSSNGDVGARQHRSSAVRPTSSAVERGARTTA